MRQFDQETRLHRLDDGAFEGRVHGSWNIGQNPNGGYLLTLAVAALRQCSPAHPDPLSVTVHFLRPGLPEQPCRIETQLVRSGRTLSTGRATLLQDGVARIEVLAAMGDLGGGTEPVLAPPPPAIPPPEDCASRAAGAYGAGMPILGRLDVRLHPDEARPGAPGHAQSTGWIRFLDGRDPDALAALLFADAFPPSICGLLGLMGWVPTVELTVQVRRRPAPGWILGQFRTHDMNDGRIIEDGVLWDATGQMVAQSRQLALVRQAGAD
jgi:acyl-CoA thioesterase